MTSMREELAVLRRGRATASTTNVPKHASRDDSGSPRNAFFVIGRARSGTTWLRSLLNAHPEVLCWGEGRLFERSIERPELVRMEGKKITPTSLYGALGRAGYLRDWIENSVWAGDETYEDHLKTLTRLCARHFMEGRLAGSGARLVGDKTPYRSAEVIGEIASVLPGARVIHTVRDGRDAAVSFVHHSWSHASSEGGVYDLSPEELSLREEYRSGSLHPPARSIFTPERLSPRHRMVSGRRPAYPARENASSGTTTSKPRPVNSSTSSAPTPATKRSAAAPGRPISRAARKAANPVRRTPPHASEKAYGATGKTSSPPETGGS